MLARLKFVVLVATATGGEWGESGDTFGVLGSTLWADQLSEFKATGKAVLPSAQGDDLYGTYVMPLSELWPTHGFTRRWPCWQHRNRPQRSGVAWTPLWHVRL